MPADTRIARARRDHIPVLARISSSADVIHDYFALGRAPACEAYEARLADLASDTAGDRFVLVAHSAAAGGIVGFLTFDDGRITYAVAGDWRRRGVATALVEGACRRAQRLGSADRVFALVDRSNVASRSVLETAGFRFTGLTREADARRIVHAALCYRWQHAPPRDRGMNCVAQRKTA
jgi:RimJ/RimL family protein N-acetyltransferase